jgi:hypothetical protein
VLCGRQPNSAGQQQGELVMDFTARRPDITDEAQGSGEQRAAQRFTLLIRAAKLVCAKGEFVCVLRDVSDTGVSVRLFHGLPNDERFDLHMPGGAVYPIVVVWQRGLEAGFQFAAPVAVDMLINEAAAFPKRGMRLAIGFPVTLTTVTQRCTAMIENLSQQGAQLECNGLFAIDQSVRIEGGGIAPEFREIRAKVRWRRGTRYGLVFDDTFTLGDFAKLAARLQAPELVVE